jgi:hypothetical protein
MYIVRQFHKFVPLPAIPVIERRERAPESVRFKQKVATPISTCCRVVKGSTSLGPKYGHRLCCQVCDRNVRSQLRHLRNILRVQLKRMASGEIRRPPQTREATRSHGRRESMGRSRLAITASARRLHSLGRHGMVAVDDLTGVRRGGDDGVCGRCGRGSGRV